MSHDEQPDAPLHGACAAEIERLTVELADATDKMLRVLRGNITQICSYCGWEAKQPGATWEELQKHITMCEKHPLTRALKDRSALLEFLRTAPLVSGTCCCGDAMEGHSNAMACGHSPVDSGAYAVTKLLEELDGKEINMSDTTLAQAPHIGAAWPSGGIYAGIMRGVNGAPDAHLIVHGDQKDKITYDDAMKWAQQLAADESYPWALTTRAEQAVLFGNVPELFEKEYYWSCEPYAGGRAYAWYQSFHSGYQGGGHKNGQLRARAVRRSII